MPVINTGNRGTVYLHSFTSVCTGVNYHEYVNTIVPPYPRIPYLRFQLSAVYRGLK
jgi:hypothetical protein